MIPAEVLAADVAYDAAMQRALRVQVPAVRRYAALFADLNGWADLREWHDDAVAEAIVNAEARTIEEAIDAVGVILLRNHVLDLT